MRLLHYGRGPIVLLEDRSQDDAEAWDWFKKPRGLWVSVEGEDDWRSWCEDEGCAELLGRFEHEVTLTEDARIKYVTNADEMDEFTSEWSAQFEPDALEAALPGISAISRAYERRVIDWPSLSLVYDGIIIAPYIYERRMASHTSWYYGWDCASGCIWRPSKAIAEIRLTRDLEAA